MKRLTYIGFQALHMGFDAHMTLIYTGRLSPDRVEEVRGILKSEEHYRRILGLRQEIKLFGNGYKTPVVTVMVPDAIRELRDRLIEKGVPNPSEFEWNPHITLDLSTSGEIRIPLTIPLINLDLY